MLDIIFSGHGKLIFFCLRFGQNRGDSEQVA